MKKQYTTYTRTIKITKHDFNCDEDDLQEQLI